MQVTESQFADDLAVYAVTCTAFESICRGFVQVGFYGLTVSLPKTKGLVVGVTVGEDGNSPMVVEGGEALSILQLTSAVISPSLETWILNK